MSCTYVGEVPDIARVSMAIRMEPQSRGAMESGHRMGTHMRTTFRPALRSLLMASTELVLGPMVQI